MKTLKKVITVFCFINPFYSPAQLIDNTASFRHINSEKYFRFHYDNDFFTAADCYYSQGINLELVHPSFKKFLLTNILITLKNGNTNYGLALEHNCFTPSSIRHSEIINNDRPFTACLLLKTFLSTVDTLKHQRISSAINIGVMGPAAFGEEMQKSIHRWLKNIEPLGWQNQVENNIIINYQLSHQQQLYNSGHFFLINTNLQVNAGTLKNDVQAGLTFTAGKFNSTFASLAKGSGNNFQIYFYIQPLLSFIVYDATLQGAIFYNNSPYVLSNNQISRLVFQNNAGIIFTNKKIYLEYYQSILTKEFNTGQNHRWGGVKLGVNL